MDLPIELKSLIEEEVERVNIKNLQKNAENISLKYRNESGAGKRLVTESAEAVSYAAVRMPATYGAVCTCLKNMLDVYEPKIESLLDVGAGTGAGSWAVCNLLDINKITCLEREDVMLNLGKSFMQQSEISVLQNAVWKKMDLIENSIEEKADLVICSYVLNELDEVEREKIVEKLWEATKEILLIIEPGTPNGFKEIKEIRKKLINLGGAVISPCPNVKECPMPENDWCHTTCRVERTKIHKLLKKGDVPYEDEKFSYVAVSKNVKMEKSDDMARVLRHPIIESGRIGLELCTKDGIVKKVITKREKELFKVARKVKCGEKIDL